eukprot:CAMPEP_0177313890 /NCGR_PEP_ID=MMETSP0368-20130122/11650_1 /TAXON_ID=447022 ORGANISM="Scrippsiella hangoei-like, Strain SHHI-4" /NCGR_SAMPLE_ID=MMETSP0368 /ASSEMBLY_ACC=CAM_ASM_000363 /LENGTH=56 /DNA_ID=CAMNT_0018773019 /DNA_START=65 /DNA_END=231 /DNA_ORIENTATION=-
MKSHLLAQAATRKKSSITAATFRGEPWASQGLDGVLLDQGAGAVRLHGGMARQERG